MPWKYRSKEIFRCLFLKLMVVSRFHIQAHLNEHLSTHSNARLYLCEICGASFKTRNVQRKHVRTIHRNPRSYKCPDCDKSFNTKFALQRHSRTHDTPDMRRNKEVPSDLWLDCCLKTKIVKVLFKLSGLVCVYLVSRVLGYPAG